MSILLKHLAFVNEQSTFHDRQIAKLGGPASWRGTLHARTAEKFKALAADLEEADKLLDTPGVTKPPPKAPIQLSLSIEDVEGLPEELVRELSLSDADKLEFEIVN